MKSLYICLILILVYSCGQKKNYSPKIIILSSIKIDDVLKKQKAKCAPVSGENCPSGIVRIFTRNQNDDKTFQLCTGILVDSNLIVTSSHCVSHQLDCDNTVMSVYMGNNLEYRTCKRFLYGEEKNAYQGIDNVDYSVLEIDQVDGWGKITSKNIADSQIGDELRAWVVDHEDPYNFRITEIVCGLTGTGLSLELIRCPVISGNSGSPLFSKSHELAGIIWGGTTGGEVTVETDLKARRAMTYKAYASPIKSILPNLR
jgi:V8-like Glu-specific endopeptidase